ncbi:MAG: glycosyltransferase involved in cell wall biosynthesis [Oceanospirillaceae bacterium]|jgi:glycosyltransferase involved in cell wall biosynthesis
MKIVNLISGKDLGGPKQTFLHYSDNLRQLGHQVTSVIRPKAQLEPLLKQRKLDYLLLDYPRTRLPLLKNIAISRLRRLFTQQNADLVIVHKPIDAALARAALPKNCQLILILHSYTAAGINAADILICVSPVLAEFALKQGYTGALDVIPNLVELNPIQPSSRPPQAIPVIATMGILRRTKGQDILLQAAAILHSRNIEFKLVIAGKGRWHKKVNKWIQQFGLSTITHRLDWVSNQDRDSFIDAADIFCLPSRGETFGMVVIEAMARKRLVVATRCGGPQGIIKHMENGLLCEINAESLADALAQAMALKAADYQAMCEQAYVTARDHYSPATVRVQIAAMLKQRVTVKDKSSRLNLPN